MRKRIIIFSIIVLIVVLSVLILNFNEDNKIIYTDVESNQIMNTNALTMMYETEAGSGEYTVSTETTWPQEGYIFNETLSKCENGGTVTWNSETNRVVMQTSSSDKCYVYFDVYIIPVVNTVTVTNITSDSITVNVAASGGSNSISRYYYSSDNGLTWVNSTSNSYTFTGLSESTTYDFKVYVVDAADYSSIQSSCSAMTESSLISFTLTYTITSETTQYYAIAGMTWTEWLESEYNTDEYYLHCSGFIYGPYDSYYKVTPNINADPNDIIEESNDYAVGYVLAPEPCGSVDIPIIGG